MRFLNFAVCAAFLLALSGLALAAEAPAPAAAPAAPAAAPAAPAAAPAAPGAAPAAPAAAPAAPAPEIFEVGKVVKDMKAKDETGKEIDLLGVSKNNKVLVFMNTACSACAEEVKFLDGFQKKNAELFDLVVVASDMGKFDRINGFKKSGRYGGIWVHDPEFLVPPRFGYTYAPAMVALDKGNKVVFSKGGFVDRQIPTIEAALLDALKK